MKRLKNKILSMEPNTTTYKAMYEGSMTIIDPASTMPAFPCMKEHSVSDCRECPGYPCDKLHDMLRRSDIKEAQCRTHCSDPDEWSLLKRAFYEKRKNLEL